MNGTKQEGPCSVEGCDQEKKTKGFCKKHYQYYLIYGHPTEKNKGDNLLKCAITDCFDPVKAKGFCDKHYTQQRRSRLQLQEGKEKERQVKICKVPGCTEPRRSLGYCQPHYSKFKRYGDPLYMKGKRICSVLGCENVHIARGWCADHYRERIHTLDLSAENPPFVTGADIFNELSPYFKQVEEKREEINKILSEPMTTEHPEETKAKMRDLQFELIGLMDNLSKITKKRYVPMDDF